MKIKDNSESKNYFIDKTLNKAINFLGDAGYNLEKACNVILASK